MSPVVVVVIAFRVHCKTSFASFFVVFGRLSVRILSVWIVCKRFFSVLSILSEFYEEVVKIYRLSKCFCQFLSIKEQKTAFFEYLGRKMHVDCKILAVQSYYI